MNVSQFENNQCTGCGYCINICPYKAIEMVCDKYGFMYPKANDKCIECGKCVRECPYRNNNRELLTPQASFAAVRADSSKLKKSSSGGVFASVAEKVLEKKNWYVTGCILTRGFKPIQIITNSSQEAEQIYGSKYVQCYMRDIYIQIKKKLEEGKNVLFSGTPCQVDAVKKYTDNHLNLYTIEVICHGVANEKMFLSYLDLFDRTLLNDYIFRDKGQGWSFNNKILLYGQKTKKINHRLSSYMTYYLNGETYRESCYGCKYACEKRGADITIGDFWGIIQKRPDLKDKIDIEKGVSCLMVNTQKGYQLIQETDLVCFPVDYEDIKEGNEPLNHPSIHTDKREKILEVWTRNNDWKDVDEYWKRNDYKFIYKLWSLVPVKIQHEIRVLLNKR